MIKINGTERKRLSQFPGRRWSEMTRSVLPTGERRRWWGGNWGHSWHGEQHDQRHTGGVLPVPWENQEWAFQASVQGECSLTFLRLRLIPKWQNPLPLNSDTHCVTMAASESAREPTWTCHLDLCPAHICSHSVSSHHLHFSSHCNCIHSASGHFRTPPEPASVYTCVRADWHSTDFTSS